MAVNGLQLRKERVELIFRNKLVLAFVLIHIFMLLFNFMRLIVCYSDKNV